MPRPLQPIDDGLHRLKTVNRGTWSGSAITSSNYKRYWELDQLGNWSKLRNGLTGSTNIIQERVHNEVNELTGFTTPGSAVDPVHDNAGNMTTAPSPKNLSTALTLKYDAWNRLTQVKNSGGTTFTANKYDGLNRRIVRDETGGSGVLKHFYYNEDWQVLVEADNSLAPTSMYAYHPHYVDAVAFKLTSSTDYVYLQDANFNVTAVVDNSGGTSGNVVERYSYTPYGEIAYLDASFAALSTQASAIGNEIFYTGRERDPETGLQLNRNRFYNAILGRWVNRDPIGYGGGANLFEYVSTSPINSVDAFGFVTDTCSVNTSSKTDWKMTHMGITAHSGGGFAITPGSGVRYSPATRLGRLFQRTQTFNLDCSSNVACDCKSCKVECEEYFQHEINYSGGQVFAVGSYVQGSFKWKIDFYDIPVLKLKLEYFVPSGPADVKYMLAAFRTAAPPQLPAPTNTSQMVVSCPMSQPEIDSFAAPGVTYFNCTTTCKTK